jgi:hypothetical protein
MNRIYLKYALIGAYLVSAVSYSCGNHKQIKELEEAQFNKELEVSNFSNLIAEKVDRFADYKMIAKNYWKSLQEKKATQPKSSGSLTKNGDFRPVDESMFDDLMKNIKEAFSKGINVDFLIKKDLVCLDAFKDLRLVLLRVVIEERCIEKLIIRYESLIQELNNIDKELTELRNN